jgi:hypothetical protein
MGAIGQKGATKHMAKQTKHVIELSDVKAVAIQCSKCPSSVSLSLAHQWVVPDKCPGCGEKWGARDGINQKVKGCADTLRDLQKDLASDGYTMGLEFEREKPAALENG